MSAIPAIAIAASHHLFRIFFDLSGALDIAATGRRSKA
jgi:hypothetical protein